MRRSRTALTLLSAASEEVREGFRLQRPLLRDLPGGVSFRPKEFCMTLKEVFSGAEDWDSADLTRLIWKGERLIRTRLARTRCALAVYAPVATTIAFEMSAHPRAD